MKHLVIGNGKWIGQSVTTFRGNGAIIAIKAVVTKKCFYVCFVVGGVPAKVLE